MAGFIEGRGNWFYDLMDVTAASNISQGTAVGLAGARTVSEYSGGQAGLLGFLKHASIDSLPAGKVIVAIPTPGCTAFCDVPTGIGASTISVGETFGITKSGGVTSFITTAAYSAASRVVTVVGPIRTADSRIEVSFPLAGGQFFSTTSTNVG